MRRTCLLILAVLAAGCSTGSPSKQTLSPGGSATPTGVFELEPPDGELPAAGVCPPGFGEVTTFVLNLDTPMPRCGRVSPGQRLKMVNKTGGAVRVWFHGSSVTLVNDGQHTFDETFGEVWQPGVHQLRTSFYGGGGPEIWLVTPTPVSPARAEETIRATVTDVAPVLMPGAIPPDWAAEVAAGADAFNVTYHSPNGTKDVLLRILEPNPPPPHLDSPQTHPKFHGDTRSLYQIQVPSDPTSQRFLIWIEPSNRAGPYEIRGGVPYFLSSEGLTDSEFWRIANGLREAPSTAQATAVSAPAFAPTCLPSQLRLSQSDPVSEATGQHTIVFALRNTAQGCHLEGYPGVTLLDGAGSALSFQYRNGGDQMLTYALPSPVDLAPQGTAYFGVNKYRCDTEQQGTAASVRVALPGSEVSLRLTLTGPPGFIAYCGPTDPGSEVSISPFEPTADSVLRANAE